MQFRWQAGLGIFFVVMLMALCAHSAFAVEHVTFSRDGKTRTVSGRLVVEAADGGVMIEGRDGIIWAITPDEMTRRTQDDAPYKPFTRAEIAKHLLAEMPEGFQVHTTAHYVICYNTSKSYAYWCGALYERLYRGFMNYWTRRGLEVKEPDRPLVALVFNDRKSYATYSKPELGDSASAIVGYYSLHTNRVTMYDLTGAQAVRRVGDRRGSTLQINSILARPQAAAMVATIIHEATHQLAFNCGLQIRFSDVPLWVSEGLAVYFETPDLGRGKGWSTIGAVNYNRLERFRKYLPNRPANSLTSLIADDKRFRDPKQALDAYAEAWALNYHLIHRYPKQTTKYLQTIGSKRPLIPVTPEQRLADFREAYGQSLKQIDADFVRHLSQVR